MMTQCSSFGAAMGSTHFAGWFILLLVLGFLGTFIFRMTHQAVKQESRVPYTSAARTQLDRLYATGKISETEYYHRLAVLEHDRY